MMPLREQLIRLAQAYATAARSKGLSGLSTKIFNDGKTLDRLAAGRDIVTGTYEHALHWFDRHWPANVPWPDGVIRPQAPKGSDTHPN